MPSPTNARRGAIRACAPIIVSGAAVCAALAMGAFGMRAAGAYETWSIDGTYGNCADCHGEFRADGYVSRKDYVPWAGGVSLHDGHRSSMLNLDCGTCHMNPRFPVYLKHSEGGTGFPPIGCLGCHGRAEPGAGGVVSGAGLRQHHTRSDIAPCGMCHTDTDPATFVAVREQVAPPYYFTPDPAHPNKPTDSCNGNGLESALSPPYGLDNDGDGTYDMADCASTAVASTTGPPFSLEGACPNPATSGQLRVAFTLSVAQPALLEAWDVSGRRVAAREVGSMGAGRHLVNLAETRAMAPGIYLLRLSQGRRVLTMTAAVVR